MTPNRIIATTSVARMEAPPSVGNWGRFSIGSQRDRGRVGGPPAPRAVRRQQLLVRLVRAGEVHRLVLKLTGHLQVSPAATCATPTLASVRVRPSRHTDACFQSSCCRYGGLT